MASYGAQGPARELNDQPNSISVQADVLPVHIEQLGMLIDNLAGLRREIDNLQGRITGGGSISAIKDQSHASQTGAPTPPTSLLSRMTAANQHIAGQIVQLGEDIQNCRTFLQRVAESL